MEKQRGTVKGQSCTAFEAENAESLSLAQGSSSTFSFLSGPDHFHFMMLLLDLKKNNTLQNRIPQTLAYSAS